MSLSVDEINKFYTKPDPWGFQHHKDDEQRKKEILAQVKHRYDRALDLGCGEGWITKDIDAKEIHGYDLSTIACDRCPDNVHVVRKPFGHYDLILACGVMYKHYDWQLFMDIIKECGMGTVITCNIEQWEVDEIKHIGKEVFTKSFPYREYNQRLRVFEVVTQYRQEVKS